MTHNKSIQFGLRRWYRKNILTVILFSIITVSIGIGVIIGRTSNPKQPIKEECQKAITIPSFEKVDYIPVIEPVIESPEPVLYFDIPLSKDLQDHIRSLCDDFSVPIELIIAIIDVESNFKAEAISKTGDHGLMQINACNHSRLEKELSITNILDPFQNTLSGIYIFSEHLERTNGDIEKALMRYNNGATGAKRLWNKGIYSTSYSKKVMSAYMSYFD